ncbi:hypothetical protein vBAbaPP1_172 [Acinetobacter phage vB_AbaM_P1]|nr:hypothetical protein vBAbaPP1_172 [Acinetobacter phage vB_AbaM_P1]WAX22654.1 hypothetical protein [Acinetobacter phage vB_AbaP_HB01]
MNIIKTTKNYIISFNKNNNVEYVKSKLNGKFAKHEEALEELKQLILEDKKQVVDAFIGLSICVLSVVIALSYIKFGISLDLGLIITTSIVSISGIGFALSNFNEDINNA